MASFKIIKVYKCFDCPYRKDERYTMELGAGGYTVRTSRTCTLIDKPIERPELFPEWCPL